MKADLVIKHKLHIYNMHLPLIRLIRGWGKAMIFTFKYPYLLYQDNCLHKCYYYLDLLLLIRVKRVQISGNMVGNYIQLNTNKF